MLEVIEELRAELLGGGGVMVKPVKCGKKHDLCLSK